MTRRHAPSRRGFLTAAVATGGAAALSACLDLTEDREPVPTGVEDPAELDDRQHAWNGTLATDEHGNHRLPGHHAFLYLDLTADGEPADDDRRRVEDALATLDRTYERSPAGLLYSIGYSPAYFERYGAGPSGVDLPPPRRLSDLETPAFDEQDALLYLASDRADVVLEVEAALFGDRETANGVEAVAFPATVADRRTGFSGRGAPAERRDEIEGLPDHVEVPDDAGLFTGFDAGFRDNQAAEARVTVQQGPFEGGTTKHVATLEQDLDRWYGENDHDDMVRKLFGPGHVGVVTGVGRNLGADSGVLPAARKDLVAAADEHGAVGHARKVAAANRDDEGRVRTLRRHVESTDGGVAGLHFPSLQRSISEFEAVREAMNGADVAADSDAVGARESNGILEYVSVAHRGNWLIPPRELRALPTPGGESL